jgi:hypothetical protein
MRDSFSLSTPSTSRDGYALWKLSDGRILWVKRMDMDDLKDDPFNAYSADDVGTIRVAVESEIH